MPIWLNRRAVSLLPSGSIVALHRCRLHCSFSPASFTPPLSLHLAQSSHCSLRSHCSFRQPPPPRFIRHRRRFGYGATGGIGVPEPASLVSPASSTPPISLHLAQSSHCFAPLALLVSPASSASLHPPQAALRLRSHWRGRRSGATGGASAAEPLVGGLEGKALKRPRVTAARQRRGQEGRSHPGGYAGWRPGPGGSRPRGWRGVWPVPCRRRWR